MALVLPTYLAGMALFSIGIIVSPYALVRFFASGMPEPSWATTPVFYHMREAKSRFIAEGLQAAVHKNPNSRVWLILLANSSQASKCARL